MGKERPDLPPMTERFGPQTLERTFVVSHISRKTSEMWGTRHWRRIRKVGIGTPCSPLQIPNNSKSHSLRHASSNGSVGSRSPTEDLMSAFRTFRPILVDATQCEHSTTITTDTGFCNVSKGDWIVKGKTAKPMYSTTNSSSARLRRFRPIPGNWKTKKAAITVADLNRAHAQEKGPVGDIANNERAQSVRRAATGSRLDALRAGNQLPRTAMTASSAMAKARVAKS